MAEGADEVLRRELCVADPAAAPCTVRNMT